MAVKVSTRTSAICLLVTLILASATISFALGRLRSGATASPRQCGSSSGADFVVDSIGTITDASELVVYGDPIGPASNREQTGTRSPVGVEVVDVLKGNRHYVGHTIWLCPDYLTPTAPRPSKVVAFLEAESADGRWIPTYDGEAFFVSSGEGRFDFAPLLPGTVTIEELRKQIK